MDSEDRRAFARCHLSINDCEDLGLLPSFSAILNAAKVMLPLTLWLTSQLEAYQR